MTLALKLLLSPLLVAQARRSRASAPALPEAAGPRSGEVGSGPALRLLMVGDSSAAGVGVATQAQAFVLPLSVHLAAALGLRVQWQLVARIGLTSRNALAFVEQAFVEQARPPACDLAVVVLGVNDIVTQAPRQRVIAHRAALTDWLRRHTGARHVCFTPLPPMHQFPLLPQPLRWVAGRDARRLDAAVARWARSRDDVSHAPMAMSLAPDTMAADGFHPGEPVYRECAQAMAEFIAAIWPRLKPAPVSAAPGACRPS